MSMRILVWSFLCISVVVTIRLYLLVVVADAFFVKGLLPACFVLLDGVVVGPAGGQILTGGR